MFFGTNLLGWLKDFLKQLCENIFPKIHYLENPVFAKYQQKTTKSRVNRAL